MAVAHLMEVAADSPVFRLRSKRGKLLLEIVKANAVASAKNVAGRPKIDRERVDRAWREQRCALLRVAIFGAQNSFRGGIELQQFG